jgi:hypothetical protein
MSKGSFDALVDKGIKVFALNPLMYYDIGPLDQSVKVFNWNALPPKYPLIDGDHLNIVYHASEWSKNLLNSHLAEELKKFIELQSNVNFIHIMEWYGHN